MLEILQQQFAHLSGNAALVSRIFEDDEQKFILLVLVAVASLITQSIHEFGHAWMADKLGDPQPRKDGRVTLAPWAHFDLMGGLLMFASVLFGLPFGWGKHVRTDPETYKINRRTGIALVALAGPFMNLFAAFLLAIPGRILLFVLSEYRMEPWLALPLIILFVITVFVMIISLSLFALNMIPIFPMDGAHVVASMLPHDTAVVYVRLMKRYGTFLFMGLMMTGVLNDPIMNFVIGMFRFLIGI